MIFCFQKRPTRHRDVTNQITSVLRNVAGPSTSGYVSPQLTIPPPPAPRRDVQNPITSASRHVPAPKTCQVYPHENTTYTFI